MRPTFVFGILLAGSLAAGAIVFLERHSNPPAPSPVVDTARLQNTVPEPPTLPKAVFSGPPASPQVLTPEEQQAANDAEIDRLQDWSENNDPQSLSNILADLASPQEDVREAAIEAAKQFGSTNAIPALKMAAMNSTDSDEQIKLLQAANFLSLPPVDMSPPTPEEIEARKQ